VLLDRNENSIFIVPYDRLIRLLSRFQSIAKTISAGCVCQPSPSSPLEELIGELPMGEDGFFNGESSELLAGSLLVPCEL
jgi:hypothetical protein